MYEPHADVKPFPGRALLFLAFAGWGMTWYAPSKIPAGSRGGIDLFLDIIFGVGRNDSSVVINQLTHTMSMGHWLEVLGYSSMGFAIMILVLWMFGASQAAAQNQAPKRPKHKKLLNEA